MTELELLADANERAQHYMAAVGKRRVFPNLNSLAKSPQCYQQPPSN